ncbi:MAG: serine/threonine protein kinase [Bacteroidaceae bacterium]|nr:serine/threonine protein kinase [Bacteroidaceae bacterium]
MQHLQPNTTLQGGKYRIERVLGQGGFGITYLAVQTSLNRYVAIKEFFMKDFCSHDEATLTMMTSATGGGRQLVMQYRNKFIKEAKNLARLHHPNIINVIEVFEENGTVYYSMPYLSGGSLQDYVDKHGALSESDAMKYVRQIASALKYMHEEQHICHYDVKPANILLDAKGNVILIDFGISKNYDAYGHETTTTPIGLSEGYAPIEQYQQNVEEFSPASDVYALGATLYFLLHAKRPASAVHRASGTPLVMDQQLSQGVKDIINASMKISKRERTQSVDVFLNNLKSATNSDAD